MPFFSGALPGDQLIELIADTLIGLSNWEDGDTTWVTTDTAARDDLGRRCLKYTGDAADIWIALELCNNTANHVVSNSTAYRGIGIRVSFSASWDEIAHNYPATCQASSMTMIPYETRTSNTPPAADLRDLLLTYYLWIDSNGFALMAVPEAHSLDNNQMSFICVVEHMVNKEYSDGLTNFYCYAKMNTELSWVNPYYSDLPYRHYSMIRPFAYCTDNYNGIQFWQDKWYAMKSTGNGKVYFVKPVICNDSDEYVPIFQSEMFFRFSPESGLVDGDVIAVEGQSTKYVCKTLQSPDSTGTLYYAIKYVA
jgi:hypothetical protein